MNDHPYHRHFNEVMIYPSPAATASAGVTSSGGGSSNIVNEHSSSTSSSRGIFPFRLHMILADAENNGLDHIVSWVKDGTLFKVHSPEQFTTLIMKRYFRHDRYKSFLRQLSMYKFVRVTDGPYRGAYGHPQFVKNQIELSRLINRGDMNVEEQERQQTHTGKKSKKASTRTAQTATAEDTKVMPAMIPSSSKTTMKLENTISPSSTGYVFSGMIGVDLKPSYHHPTYYERPSPLTVPGASMSQSNCTVVHNTKNLTHLRFGEISAASGAAAVSSQYLTADILDEIICTFGGGGHGLCDSNFSDGTCATSSLASSSTLPQMDESMANSTMASTVVTNFVDHRHDEYISF